MTKNPKEPNESEPTTPSNPNSNPDSLLPDGIRIQVSITDNTGHQLKNQTFIPDSLLTGSNIEPPALVMEALRHLSAELVSHAYPVTPPVHPNKNGNLN